MLLSGGDCLEALKKREVAHGDIKLENLVPLDLSLTRWIPIDQGESYHRSFGTKFKPGGGLWSHAPLVTVRMQLPGREYVIKINPPLDSTTICHQMSVRKSNVCLHMRVI